MTYQLLLVADDEAAANAGAGITAQVMGQAQVRVLYLPGTRLSLELLVDLVHHAQAAGTQRVTEAFEAAVGIDR